MPWVSRSNPTYLRVYARQRPGGVAWDAVPSTVRGLNKAAGNPQRDVFRGFEIIYCHRAVAVLVLASLRKKVQARVRETPFVTELLPGERN